MDVRPTRYEKNALLKRVLIGSCPLWLYDIDQSNFRIINLNYKLLLLNISSSKYRRLLEVPYILTTTS